MWPIMWLTPFAERRNGGNEMTDQERNAKIKYLESYKWLNAEIEDDEERLARLDARLYSPGVARYSDMPRGGQPVTIESLVNQKKVLQEQINAKCARRREILNRIENLPDHRDRRILKLEFIDDLTHEQVAERINYSVAQTRRYYEAALERFEL
jgi:DNA-directed RNA polymerase specialized sigma subunit